MYEIVVIDDEKAVLGAIKRELHNQNYNVHLFDEPAKALAHCAKVRPDLVLSDIRMPGIDGIEIMSRLASIVPDVSRILMSGYSDKDSLIDAVNNGHVNFFIEKPWETTQLVDTIEKALELVRVKKENLILTSKIKDQNDELKLLNGELDQKVSDRTRELHDAYESTVNTFSSLVEKRFKKNKFSSRDVAILCDDMAIEIGLSEADRHILNQAAMLRNIGKVGFSDKLLATPRVKMDESMFKEFCRHPVHAQISLSLLPPLKETAKVLLQHMECYDGTGFPKSLSGNDVKIESEILHICCDYFDARSGLLEDVEMDDGEVIKFLKKNKNKYSKTLLKILFQIKRTEEVSHVSDDGIPTHSLKSGMKISRDLYSDTGVLLLVKDKVLTKSMIDHMVLLEKNTAGSFDVYVYR
ncbi:MAG: response regulator [Agarilytica sp.]